MLNLSCQFGQIGIFLGCRSLEPTLFIQKWTELVSAGEICKHFFGSYNEVDIIREA